MPSTELREDRAIRVLVLHSRYLSGPASGENRVVEDESRLLREAGHDVRVWAPATTPGQGSRVALGAGAVWSRAAVAEVARLVQLHRPEVIHVHNVFPMLSPAAIRAAGGGHLPVVMTLHNYRMACLPATLFRSGDVCEACVGRVPWRGVVHRCYRGSLAGSAALAASLTLHRLLRTWDRVDLFLAISRFVRTKHLETGLPPGRVRVKPHFAWPSPRRSGPGEHFLYLGRLTEEKGVTRLVEAWGRAPGRLLVVGDGPEWDRLAAAAPPNVELRRTVPFSEVPSLLSRARALLVPSLWHEGAGKVVLEAYAAGVPVLASRAGALPEFIDDGVSGLVLPPRQADAWVAAADRLMNDDEAERMGQQAWRLWQQRYSPQQGIGHLERAYADAAAGVGRVTGAMEHDGD